MDNKRMYQFFVRLNDGDKLLADIRAASDYDAKTQARKLYHELPYVAVAGQYGIRETQTGRIVPVGY